MNKINKIMNGKYFFRVFLSFEVDANSVPMDKLQGFI